MRRIFFAVALLAGALPFVALAQSTSNPGVSSLIAELSSLEQEITSLSGSSSVAASPAPVASNAAQTSVECPALYRTLSYGSSGADVVGLQTFLSQEGFFDAQATGYFGSITQSAVGAWQEKEGIVSGGDADSTGLGVVGPKTRAAISSMCGANTSANASAQSQCLPTQPPTTDCPAGWQPVTDSSGCTMYYQCSIALPVATTTQTVPQIVGTTTSCPVVQQPTCSGTVEPFQTDSNGCVTAYECVL